MPFLEFGSSKSPNKLYTIVTSMSKTDKIIVKDGGSRLDTVVCKEHDYLTKRDIKRLCAAGRILVNSQTARPGMVLKPNDCVELNLETPPSEALEALRLNIVFEDDHLIVLLKPRALHCVSQKYQAEPTLADALAQYSPSCRSAGKNPLESGLVQRLDYFTSGLINAAKDKTIWNLLHQALTAHEIKKEYLALVEGVPIQRDGSIETYLKLNKKSVSVQKVKRTGYVEAKTDYSVIWSQNDRFNCSIIRAATATGKRHQIRAHLAYLGHPLVGDELYGSVSGLSSVTEICPEWKDGFLLHASKICLTHPISRKPLSFENQPEEIKRLCRTQKK